MSTVWSDVLLIADYLLACSLFQNFLLVNPHPIESRQPVGLLRRFGAIVYDGLLLFAVLFFASLVVVIPFGITYEHPLYPLYILYIYAAALVFLGWFWTQRGQTLGMKTWGIQVEQTNGQWINWKQAITRYLSALLFYIPAAAAYWLFPPHWHHFLWVGLLPIAADYSTCFFNHDKHALHDMISQTHLVLIKTNN